MLEIKDLRASAGDKEILKGINLTVNAGEVHAVMGPNGSGKSTLAQVLAGHPAYEVTAGSVSYMGQDLLDMEPEERAQAGVFLAFQYPVEIPGVTNAYFLRAAYNEIRKARGLEEVDPMDFLDLLEEKLRMVEWGPEIMSRAVNAGFSGGEKKRNEILQMAVLEPKLAILDETDSGLDIDALRIVANGVNKLRNKDRSFIVVTHYQRLLNYIVPDYVHVLAERPDRQVRRQGPGPRARGQGLRMGGFRGGGVGVSEPYLPHDAIPAGAGIADGPEWLEPIRRAAAERFAATGFPTSRQEEWRFTPVTPIAQGTWRAAQSADGGRARSPFLVQVRTSGVEHAGLREWMVQ